MGVGRENTKDAIATTNGGIAFAASGRGYYSQTVAFFLQELPCLTIPTCSPPWIWDLPS